MRITAAGDLGVGNTAPVNIGGGYVNVHVGRCGGGAYSRGYLTLAQDFNNGSVRQLRMGYNDFLEYVIGDWGGTNANNAWTGQIRLSYASLFDALVIPSSGLCVMRYGYTSSDQRIKRNIKTIQNSLYKVLNLRGVEYISTINDMKQIGLIAQEVENIIPELVYESDTGLKSLAYGNMAGLFVNAIKELNEIIMNQQTQINELKNILKNNNLI